MLDLGTMSDVTHPQPLPSNPQCEYLFYPKCPSLVTMVTILVSPTTPSHS